jgi:drug/metabolite transporter (DMT)-like permease
MVAWSLWFLALPLLLPVLFIIGIPSINQIFWYVLPIGGAFNIVATILYMKAIKHSDLSLTVPMVAFTPLFLLITSPLLVNELPHIFGLIGVLLIIGGSFLFNIKQYKKGILEPFKALLRQQGPRLMLIVAFIWSISSNIDKIGVTNSSPILWITSMAGFISVFMAPIVLFRNKTSSLPSLVSLKMLLPIGLIYGLTIMNQMNAIQLTLVSYTISIKRTSTIFAVIWGYLIFKEHGIRERLLGTVIMIIGVVFITLL